MAGKDLWIIGNGNKISISKCTNGFSITLLKWYANGVFTTLPGSHPHLVKTKLNTSKEFEFFMVNGKIVGVSREGFIVIDPTNPSSLVEYETTSNLLHHITHLLPPSRNMIVGIREVGGRIMAITSFGFISIDPEACTVSRIVINNRRDPRLSNASLQHIVNGMLVIRIDKGFLIIRHDGERWRTHEIKIRRRYRSGIWDAVYMNGRIYIQSRNHIFVINPVTFRIDLKVRVQENGNDGSAFFASDYGELFLLNSGGIHIINVERREITEIAIPDGLGCFRYEEIGKVGDWIFAICSKGLFILDSRTLKIVWQHQLKDHPWTLGALHIEEREEDGLYIVRCATYINYTWRISRTNIGSWEMEVYRSSSTIPDEGYLLEEDVTRMVLEGVPEGEFYTEVEERARENERLGLMRELFTSEAIKNGTSSVVQLQDEDKDRDQEEDGEDSKESKDTGSYANNNYTHADKKYERKDDDDKGGSSGAIASSLATI